MENTIQISIADCEEELQADLKRLASAAAIKGGVLPLAEVAELHWRREAVIRAYRGGALEPGDQDGLLPRSIAVGGVTLHDASIAVRIRLRKIAAWKQPKEWNNCFVAYLLAHSFDPDGLAQVATLDGAKATVEKWAENLCCTEPQLVVAIHRVCDASLPDLPPAARADAATQKKTA